MEQSKCIPTFPNIFRHFPAFSNFSDILVFVFVFVHVFVLVYVYLDYDFHVFFRTFSNFLDISQGLKNLQPISVYPLQARNLAND